MMANATKAKTRTFTQKARRAQIVQAAIETLAESGYAKASFARISRQAKLSSTGMISYHFSGKPELFAEVARTVIEQAQELTAARVADETTHRGRLSAYITSGFDFVARHPLQARALSEIVRMVRDGRITGLDDVEHTVTSVESLVTLLRQGREAGEFGTFDCRTMALAVRGATDNVLRHHLYSTCHQLQSAARELAEVIDRCTRPD
ncbi:TetR/AcrR family transcriptional regulator [Streptomyces sp. Tu 3180]|uniref:TetR/AcrR family transcriptional regulator n=1 Tax=Streptomyces sp. Tu 3180 TaxID=2682611 RepID=UPI0013569EE4|nr:TetR/AcrR family transcriptional regulator [Streptomyces sp. Tu 3180]KAF3463555.1 TetR family transcriptional regulator [Streptomyces sp. Tu 3180]